MEDPFPYNYDDFKRWKNGDETLRKRLLAICGNLGQDEKVYYTQKGQHFPEATYAAHLVHNRGFQKETIVYEKYRLSYCFLEEQKYKNSDDARRFVKSYNLLKNVFSLDFFREFDELVKKNLDRIERSEKRKISVDLCAINLQKSLVHFYEIKRCEPGPKCNDTFKNDQKLFLAFVNYIVESLGVRAFCNQNEFKVKTGIIIFIPNQDIPNYIPKESCVCFNINKRSLTYHP